MFKISNLDSFTEEEKAIAAQSSVLDHLTSAGFTVPVIIPSLSGRLCEKATLSSTGKTSPVFSTPKGSMVEWVIFPTDGNPQLQSNYQSLLILN